jgi:hypothetical protein
LSESYEDTSPEAWVLSLLLGIYREHMRNLEKGDKHKANNLVASCLDMSCNNLENVWLICSFCVTQAPTICKSTITN